jgi:hypothetical protein
VGDAQPEMKAMESIAEGKKNRDLMFIFEKTFQNFPCDQM